MQNPKKPNEYFSLLSLLFCHSRVTYKKNDSIKLVIQYKYQLRKTQIFQNYTGNIKLNLWLI